MNLRKTAETLLDGFKINLDGAIRARVIEAMIAGMAVAAANNAKAEREACAKICDAQADQWAKDSIGERASTRLADLIRARSEG